MATGVNADLTLSVRFASNQLPLYVKQKDTVEYVIKKAAAALKEDREGMVLFFKGTRLNERDNIGVSKAVSIHPYSALPYRPGRDWQRSSDGATHTKSLECQRPLQRAYDIRWSHQTTAW